MDLAGIIFSDAFNKSLDELTRNRTVASLPFGGRYRQIDFVLSNMVNSGITAVGVIKKSNYRSLMDHLGTSQEWDLNRKKDGLKLLPPFVSGQSAEYRGKLDMLRAGLSFLNYRSEEYILIAETNIICSIDFQPVLKAHIDSGCDVTVVATRAAGNTNDPVELVLEQAEDGSVSSLSVEYAAKAGMYESLNMYILSRKLLTQSIEDMGAQGLHHFERDFLQRGLNNGRLRIGIYEYRGIALRNSSVAAYFQNSMELLNEAVMDGLFRPDAPIYTKVRDESPSYYGDDAKVSDCIIADGCTINASVERSILFRAVTINKGADVKNAVIMQGSRIGEGAILENVIIDKGVTVSPYVHLRSSPHHPIILHKGEIV
jgi:glucose-1-phosphate adenylyltransferase